MSRQALRGLTSSTAGPWEPIFDSTNGVLGDDKGAWESGVEAVNGGAWREGFPAR